MHFVEMLMTDPKTGQSIPPVNTLYDEVGNYCVEINLPPPHVSGERVKRLVLNLNESQAHFVGCRYTLPRPYTVEDGRDREIHISVQPAPFFQGEEWYVEGYYASVMSEMISMAEFLCSFYGVSIWDMLEAFLTGRFPPQPAIEIFSNSIRVERVDGPDEVISKRRNKAFSRARSPFTHGSAVGHGRKCWPTPGENIARAQPVIRRARSRPTRFSLCCRTRRRAKRLPGSGWRGSGKRSGAS